MSGGFDLWVLSHPLARHPPVGRARRGVVCHRTESDSAPGACRVTGWSGREGRVAVEAAAPGAREGLAGRRAGCWVVTGCRVRGWDTPTTADLHGTGAPPPIREP